MDEREMEARRRGQQGAMLWHAHRRVRVRALEEAMPAEMRDDADKDTPRYAGGGTRVVSDLPYGVRLDTGWGREAPIGDPAAVEHSLQILGSRVGEVLRYPDELTDPWREALRAHWLEQRGGTSEKEDGGAKPHASIAMEAHLSMSRQLRESLEFPDDSKPVRSGTNVETDYGWGIRLVSWTSMNLASGKPVCLHLLEVDGRNVSAPVVHIGEGVVPDEWIAAAKRKEEHKVSGDEQGIIRIRLTPGEEAAINAAAHEGEHPSEVRQRLGVDRELSRIEALRVLKVIGSLLIQAGVRDNATKEMRGLVDNVYVKSGDYNLGS